MQGLMSLHLEQVPYIREAAYLSRHINGSSTETPAGVLRLLLRVFEETPEAPSRTIERYGALARAISVEVCAPLALERTHQRLHLDSHAHRILLD